MNTDYLNYGFWQLFRKNILFYCNAGTTGDIKQVEREMTLQLQNYLNGDKNDT
jgi:hypothetical protein